MNFLLEMDGNTLAFGGEVVLVGMGTVFVFLTIMIFAMNINEIVLKFVGKYFPEEVPEVKCNKKKVENSDDEIALAIACAVHKASKA